MPKEYILGVRKGSFTPEGESRTIEYCNAHLLDAPNPEADPLGERGRFPSKVRLDPNSFMRFDKAGEYNVNYNRSGKSVILEIKA